MTDTILVIALVIFAILAGFIVFFILDARRSHMAFRAFIRNTEENLTPALIEMKLTLESLRAITDDIGSVTAEVRDLSDTLAHVSSSVRKASGIVDDIGIHFSATMAGLQAGIKEGVLTLFTNLISRKEK